MRKLDGEEEAVIFWVIVILDWALQGYFKARGWGVFNSGVSFGGLAGWGQGVGFILYFSLFILYLSKMGGKKMNRGVVWVLVGGVGNLLPRLWWGGVWDYLHVLFLPFWFNLSDVLITVGVVSYILGINGNRDFLRG